MRKNSKDKITILVCVISVVLIAFLMDSYKRNSKQQRLLDGEMLRRMECEERALRLSARSAGLNQQIKQLNVKLLEQEALKQEIKDLKDDLEKLTKLKEKLEENLKEALVSPEGGD